MSDSPWNAYGRRPSKPDARQKSGKLDLTFGAEREAMLTHEQLKKYLERTFHEYHEIRAGRAGYARIVAEALKPPPRPESIEETLRRLSGTRARGAHRHRSDPPSTV